MYKNEIRNAFVRVEEEGGVRRQYIIIVHNNAYSSDEYCIFCFFIASNTKGCARGPVIRKDVVVAVM